MLLCGLLSCGSAGDKTLQASKAGPGIGAALGAAGLAPLQLPAPAALESDAAPRGASMFDRQKTGSEYDPALAHSRVFSAAPAASFVPSGATFDKVAFAVYQLPLMGYDGAKSVSTSWATNPAAGTLYYGVADYGSNSWHWIAGNPTAAVSLPGSLDILSPLGNAYIAVVLSGSDQHDLNELVFGESSGPLAVLHLQYSFADTGTTINFDGSASSAEGNILKYEWDLDGDGSFEVNSGVVPNTSKSYPLAADITIKLRVTDDANQVDVATAPLKIDSNGYDEVEPNNAVGNANQLPSRGFNGFEGNLGPGGYDGGFEDFYRFSLSEPAVVKFRCNPSGALVMLLYDSTGTTQIDGSITDFEHRFAAAGDYILKVYVDILQPEPIDYSLSMDLQDASYDEVEPNNEPAAYNEITLASADGYWGNLGADGYDGGSEDWFLFHPPTLDHYYVFQINYFSPDLTLDIELYEQDGITLLGSTEVIEDYKIGYQFYQSTALVRCKIRSGGNPLANSDYQLKLRDAGPVPVVELNASPDTGTRPLHVDFDVSGTLPPDTYVYKYYWDLNGDNVADQVTDGAQSTISATYYRGEASYSPKVKVILNTDAAAVAATSVSVSGAASEVEPNNSYAQVQALPGFPISNYYGDVGYAGYDGGYYDYYSFSLPGSQSVTFTMDYQPGFNSVGLYIVDFDGSNETILSESYDQDGQETVSYSNSSMAPKTLYLVVASAETDQLAFSGYRLSGSAF